MNDFLKFGSLRRRPSAKAKLPRPGVEGAPPAKMAERTSTCLSCGELIIKDRDTIVFDYVTRMWVHDNGKCRSNDTLHMT